MPIFKAGEKLVQYAHVPKCGGSSVSWYLSERFGKVAFNDSLHTRHDPRSVWSKTSPQHIDRESMGRLFPDGFFDAVFTIVRHPVARVISAYHFQVEVEKSISSQVAFSEWLADLEELCAENPFIYDNHVRSMTEIVPEGATVFHMEHGLDALVQWFDDLTGTQDAPRAVPKINERGNYAAPVTVPVKASPQDLDLIFRLYAQDFERFGYTLNDKAPKAPRPELSETLIAERDLALRKFNSPLGKITRKITRKIGI